MRWVWQNVRAQGRTRSTHAPKSEKCVECNEAFAAQALGPHQKWCQQKVKNFTCDRCGKLFKTRQILQTHCLVPNKCNQIERRRSLEVCPKCGKALLHVRAHLPTCQLAMKVKCELCGKILAASTDLKRHQKSCSKHEPNAT